MLHRHFNDQNQMAQENYVDIEACDFVVDFVAPGGDSLAARYDPNGNWSVISSMKIMDRLYSPWLTRVLYFPVLNGVYNNFGMYVLYETARGT